MEKKLKKQKEFYANKRNTPNLDLYTSLIGLAYGSMAFNCFLTFVYAEVILKWEYSQMCLILCIIMLVLIPLTMKDPRREDRGFFAVLCDYIMCTVLTIAITIFADIYWMFGVYTIEMIIASVVIVHHIRNKKNNKKRF